MNPQQTPGRAADSGMITTANACSTAQPTARLCPGPGLVCLPTSRSPRSESALAAAAEWLLPHLGEPDTLV